MVEHRYHLHVDGVAGAGGVARREVDAHLLERLCVGEVGERLVNLLLAVELLAIEHVVLEEYSRFDRCFLALIGIFQSWQNDAVVVLDDGSGTSALRALLAKGIGGDGVVGRSGVAPSSAGDVSVFLNVGVDISDVPLSVGAWIDVCVGYDECLYSQRYLHGVGEETDVVGTIVVEAVVSEVVADAYLLSLKVGHTELRSFFKIALLHVRLKDAVLNTFEMILDAVEHRRLVQIDIVLDFLLLGVLLIDEVVCHSSTEITIVLEGVGGNFHSGFGKYGGDGDGFGSEGFQQPFFEGVIVLVDEGIVNPQTDREGGTQG